MRIEGANPPFLRLDPGGPKAGLGLWNSTVGTLAVESALFAVGLGLYLRTTRARDRVGLIALWGFVALLYVSSLFAPPPSWRALAWGGSFSWLLILFAQWLDRHRTAEQVAKDVA